MKFYNKPSNNSILKEIKRVIKLHFSITILFFILCFSEFAFAQQLNPEQIKRIESLAFTLEEPMTFYRWEWNEQNAKQRIQDGEITPEYYQALLEKDRGIKAGKGLYLSESASSSSELNLSNALIEVEVAKGVRVLDIEANRDILLRARISEEDLYALEMDNLLLSDFREKIDDWWVLKGRTGVKFKPFSIQNASLQDLFVAQTLDFASRKYPFNQIDFEGHIKKRVKQALVEPIQNVTDAMFLFVLGEPYFSPQEREKAFGLVLNNINNTEDSLKPFKQWEISGSKLKHILKANRHTRSENRSLLSFSDKEVDRFYERLSPDEGERLFNHVLDRISTIQDALSFIVYGHSQADKKPKKGKINFFDDKHLKQIAEKVKDQPIRSLEQADSFLLRTEDLLSAEDLNRIIERAIPRIKHIRDSIVLLKYEVISPTNKAKIYKRVSSFTLDVFDDRTLYSLLSMGVPIELENYIVSRMNRRPFDKQHQVRLLSYNLSEENKDKIITQLLRYYDGVDRMASIIIEVQDHISLKQKYRLLDNLAEQASTRLNQFELSEFTNSASPADFQYFEQSLQREQSERGIPCSKALLDSL